MKYQKIELKKVNVHNLKSVDLTLDTHELIVFTGVSGSGKSSLAFDTIYAEGQRRYVESLSTFAKRQLGEMAKPELESADGISPTISIEQKTAGKNPRSTVGTLTEIYDYLRVLYARIGEPHCPISGERVSPQSRERIIKTVQKLPENTKLTILASYAKSKKGEFKDDFLDLLRKGFTRVRVDGQIIDLNNEISLEKNIAHDIDIIIDRVVVKPNSHSRIAEALTTALNEGKGICSILNAETEEETLFSMYAYSPKSGLSYSSLHPQDFSFNSPAGMCDRCSGLGRVTTFDLTKIIDPNLSISEDCCSIASPYKTVRYGNIYENLARLYDFDITTPWKKLPESAKKVFLYGTEKKWTRMQFIHPETGAVWTDHIRWRGVLYEAHQRYTEAKSDRYRQNMDKLMTEQVCPECQGKRLKPYPAATLLNGQSISELTALTITECHQFFKQIKLTDQDLIIAEELLKEITERLQFLLEVGLHYLTLDRTAPTLSGGEAQRVRLASQIGCGLVGITYILDEPSIGLHPRDNHQLIKTLKHLRDIGNTVIVVEHDEETIWDADRIVDFGPGAGQRGGEILVNGTHANLLTCERSITAQYLSGKQEIVIPKKRRKKGKKSIEICGATHHNLKNINVKIPLEFFIAVTGVSGSGKSSLITETLYPALANHLHKAEHTVGAHKSIKGIDAIDKIIAIDQSPIGRNPRSNPATYIKLFDEIRDLFTKLPESQARGYQPGRFSFNVGEGSCTQCNGMGLIKVDMDFMEDAWVDCPLCHGKRFDPETLSIYYKGKNIYDVLEMEVIEALDHFGNIPSIRRKLETLQRVGMEYIKLGQSSTTLSGGEAQRIKLAKELVRPATGRTLYIFDEPTTGLHFHDINHLLKVLHELVDRGNTVLAIEHNMDLVKTADWIIDIGPEGGAGGGEVVAAGTPEQIAKLKTPTGCAVHEALYPDRKRKIAEALQKAEKHSDQQLSREKNVIHEITVKDAEQNNLKNVTIEIPREKITICTGPSGSGKSSLAFETIYAEGQRRYIESLSPYARQFVKQMSKPKVGQVEGLSPAVAIEQKIHAGNPRSTVGTMTEIYDYLRVLYTRLGIPHCPETGEVIRSISKESVCDKIMSLPEGEKIQVLAPIAIKKNDKFDEIITKLTRQGFVRIRLNGVGYTLDDIESINAAYDRKRKNVLELVIDRLVIKPGIEHRLYEAVERAAAIGEGQLMIATDSKDMFYNLAFAVESTGKSYPKITPHTFAFNVAEGMCHDCQGLGYQYGANIMENAEFMQMSSRELMQFLWWGKESQLAKQMLDQFFYDAGIDPDLPLHGLESKQLQFLLNGMEGVAGESGGSFKSSVTGVSLKDSLNDSNSLNDVNSSISSNTKTLNNKITARWIGINTVFAKMGKSGVTELKDQITPILHESVCLSCHGTRINALARHVTIKDLSIADLCHLSVDKALDFIEKIDIPKSEKTILEDVYAQLKNRLKFLCDVGIQYISLDRKAPSLSGGEAQRIRLARQLGSGLTGVLYVLDEPTIGLHPSDNDKLNEALKKLKDLGNTLIMVEHDPQTIKTADYILDFGPHGGDLGGHIMAKGTYEEILNDPHSLTGAYLSGKKEIPIPEKRRSRNHGELVISEANIHNLKNINVAIPVKSMTCLTGVSGSGKSSLMMDVIYPAVKQGLNIADSVTLNGKGKMVDSVASNSSLKNKKNENNKILANNKNLKSKETNKCLANNKNLKSKDTNGTVSGIDHFDKMLVIDQDPIGLTSRSDVCTYVDVLTKIREFFTELPLAKTKGLKPANFSYNHRRGMCTNCWGMGYKRVELFFLPAVRVTCDACNGMRLNPVSLEVTYKERNLGQYLQTTVDEARSIFSAHPKITRILDTLISVGLGYLKLGQEMATLSGGEAQRIKLSRELAKRSTGKTLYLLDEPTTGLHADDINTLLSVLHRLVDKGNTLVVIEHNVAFIKNCDYLIDLGPEGGEKGGYVVATGTPEELVKNDQSVTGRFLI